MPIVRDRLGYANTNLSGRHFNGETTAFGQRERRRERSEYSLRIREDTREDTRSDSLKVGSQSVSQIAGQRGQPGPGRRGEKERKEGRTKRRGKKRERRERRLAGIHGQYITWQG